jgi:alkanesulfonate monooxygenase SsuD/methylene tetrahydromethanopterin reductase-like flavin-dependent oxidoreductase (luciferase family)
VLVSPVTFRHPGSFAKVVTTVDEMSGGRIEVGVGAGWHELEHRQLGLPFPDSASGRTCWRTSWPMLHGSGGEPDGWSFDGNQVRSATRSSIRSRSTCRHGADADRRRAAADPGRGSGSPRSYRIAARYADEFNVSSSGPQIGRASPTPSSTPHAGRSAGIRPRGSARRWPAC